MRKLGAEEWLVSAVMSMYAGAKQLLEQFMVLEAGIPTPFHWAFPRYFSVNFWCVRVYRCG